MNLLVLGGTVFLGRHIVEAAQQRGHRVTLFNRGRSNPRLFPELERLAGDRDGDLSALAGRSWDAAIDTCGYLPRVVRASAEALAGAVERYAFVSSISVYSDGLPPGVDETAPVARIPDPAIETVDGRTYGPLKALCEAAAEAAMPGRVLNLRPGLIVGPGDPTDRFTYWPLRIARGGPFLAPEGPEAPAQIIDVRDLADWTVRAIEAGRVGTYNACGPVLGLGEVFEACRVASGSAARPVWCPPETLLAAGLRPFLDLPLWVPPAEQGLCQVDGAKARAAGLRCRPIGQTVADTLAWAREARPEGRPLRAGPSPEREAELLAGLAAG
ncbi:MAG: epimerase [Caldilineae bacterium]|nr:epimerase [Chloroflexota bacterium]MCB9176507.1 epimerase [Caldilineae bacterium]